MVNGASVFRDITNQSIHGDFIRNRLYNSTKGEPIPFNLLFLCNVRRALTFLLSLMVMVSAEEFC